MPILLPRSSAAAFSLPDKACARWTPARKAHIAAAIMLRRITMDAALKAYLLSEEELGSWLLAYKRFGLLGLYATRRARP